MKVLARFMGYEYGEIWYWTSKGETQWQRDNKELIDELGIESVGEYWINKETKDWFEADELNFHNDWSQLMPVVEKIESMGYFFIIKPRTVETYRQIPAESLNITAGKTKIEAVFKACVEFIEWYNANKQL